MRPGKTTHIFQLGSYSVKFTGNFDSGNLRNVLQVAPFEYEIEPAIDSYQFQTSSKAFFHFLVQGFPEGQKVILVFRNLSLLNSLKEDGKRYIPFTSTDGINYRRLSKEQIQVYDIFEGLCLRINIEIKNIKTFFSFGLPYSYERYLNMIRDLPQSNDDIYINKQVLCYSNNLNLVYLVTITSQSKFLEKDERVCQNSNGIILPQKHLRPARKYCDKPAILISSRVHPGQTASSWAVEGIIKFLISDSQDAKKIRKNFQIVIVPMLNPDGVEEGLYRLDTKGHNLNRYYLVSDNRQPSIYSMKHLIRYYQQTKRLLYYFDFHGHPSQKGAFLYGNAIDDLPFQVQTELFGRLLKHICPTFQQKFCIYDKQQMNSKDRFDLYTKQGCARVFTFKLSGIIHSYTIEMGFHGLSDPSSKLLYEQEDYYNEGRCIMEAVLISSGLKQNPKQTLQALRKQLVSQICNREQRFRRQERFLQQKKNNINQILQVEYWKPIYQHHFNDTLKVVKKNSFHPVRHKLKFQKKDSNCANIQSFCSEQTINQKLINRPSCEQEQRQQKTSLGQGLQQPKKGKLEHKNFTFKLLRTNNSFKSTNVSTKSDLQEKLLSKKVIRLPLKTYHSIKDQIGNTSVFKQKLKSLKKPIGLRSIEHSYPKEQQFLFSDINIRQAKFTEYSSIRPISKSTAGKNKIHSLFIQTHY